MQVAMSSRTRPQKAVHMVGPMHGTWRWLKRVLEAITVIGAVVGFFGGSSIDPL